MKKTLLFAAVLCGLTSFAVDPVAVWNGDFTETTKGDYTLSANGNTVAEDGSSITISTQKGVTFERSSALGKTVGMTVIYKFDNLVVGSTVKTIATASAGGGNADRVGVNIQASGQTSGIWENTKTHNTSATQTTISSIESDGQFALVYGPEVSNNTGTYLYLKNGTADYVLAYSCGGLKGGSDTVQAMTVGGTRQNGTTFPAASGMVIKAVAMFDRAMTKDEIAAYSFPTRFVSWSNLDSSSAAATHFTVGGTKTQQITLNLPATDACQIGTKIAISKIKIANGEKSMSDTMAINGVVGNKCATTESFSRTYGSHTFDRLYVYEFSTPAIVEVGKDYTVTIAESQFSAIQDPNSPMKISNLTGAYATNYNCYCSVEGEIYTATGTTAEINGGAEISVSAINEALIETDNKAEVTLEAGAIVTYDAALTVPTKLICEGAITLSAAEKPDLTKLDLSGVTGGIVRTWMTEAEKKGIGFNFASKRGPVTTAALVADAAWYDNNDGGSNDEGKNGTNVAMSSDGLTTITWTSNNTYDDDASTHGANSSASMVRGYLDDGSGVTITVKNVPFAEYAVIIYASTDDPNNPKLTHKVVNGENYTYDSSCTDVAKVGTAAWGQGRSSSTVAYGTNAIRVIAQTNGTLMITSPKNTSIKARGCLSAIQIVPYTTFVNPTVKIAAVETKCSEDYSSNTITGTIADYVANSWEGDLTARVVVNSTAYESAAIGENGEFSIEVSGLDRETVYRTVLEIGYVEKDVFTSIATKPVAIYQGERKFVWIASPFVIQEKTSVNDANGLTIADLFDDPDYVDLCDSEYTVSISASEAVDATADAALEGNEQGGIRIAEVNNALKLQVIDNGEWVDFADATVDTTYTMTVKFHYQKEQEGETAQTSVTYTLDKTTKEATNKTDKLKVTELFVSDGTNLSDDLLGACQFDKAVIVDIELKPGEGDAIDYDSEEKANAALKTLKVGICDAVKAVLTTTEAQNEYRSYFHLVVVPSTTLQGGYSVITDFTSEAKSEIEKEIEDALAQVVDGFNIGSAEIAAKPGLYYGVKRGNSLENMNIEETTLATSDKVTIKITKPNGASAHFYRIIVSPTPTETK